MLLVRELIRKGKVSDCIIYEPESVQSKRWGWLFLGCAAGSCVYRLLTRIFREIHIFSGDSYITLLLGLTAFTGVDASAGYLLSPEIKMQGRSIPYRALLWSVYIALILFLVNRFGPLNTVRSLIVFSTLRHGNNANVNLLKMIDTCENGPMALRLRSDEEFAEYVAEKMLLPFGTSGW